MISIQWVWSVPVCCLTPPAMVPHFTALQDRSHPPPPHTPVTHDCRVATRSCSREYPLLREGFLNLWWARISQVPPRSGWGAWCVWLSNKSTWSRTVGGPSTTRVTLTETRPWWTSVNPVRHWCCNEYFKYILYSWCCGICTYQSVWVL